MDKQRREARRLMPSDGFKGEGIWGEAGGPQGGTTEAGRTGATTRKNPKKEESKELLAFAGAMPSGATAKSAKSTSRWKATKKKTLEKAYKSPFAAKKSGRRKKRGKAHTTAAPAASAPPGAATPAVVSRGRGKANKKSDRKVAKAARKRTMKKGKREATREKPARKKAEKRKRNKGKGKGEAKKEAEEPSSHTMAAADLGEGLVPGELQVIHFPPLEIIPRAASRFDIEEALAEGGDAVASESSAAGGGSATDGMSPLDYLIMAAGMAGGEEPAGVGVGAGGDSAAPGSPAAGGGSRDWEEGEDEEL